MKTKYNGEIEYFLNEISEIKAGGSFGELSLLYESLTTATIKCKEECDFAVLQKAEYKEILGIFNPCLIGVYMIYKLRVMQN